MIALAIGIFCWFNLFAFTSADRMLERVRKEGISIECHYITTSDGYILRLYHMPPQPNATDAVDAADTDRKPLKPIFFMHGLQSSSLDYVIYPNISSGYYFTERGYDVWLGNARGNTFSRNHTTLNPDKIQFWKFNLDSIALIDLPTMIDFVLDKTNQSQLIYLGYSQGGFVGMALLSERPEYNQKIALMHSMGGAIIMKNSHAIIAPFLEQIAEIKNLAEQIPFFEWNSFRRNSKVLQPLGEICVQPFVTEICKCILGYMFGPFAPGSYYNELLMDYSMVNPSGSSYIQYIHFGQLYLSGRFQKFDYGPSKNMKLYKNRKPPEYDLSNVQTNVHIIYGTNDYLVDPATTPILINKLNGSVVAVDELPYFNHLDFVMGRLVHKVQPIILRVINKFT